MSGPSDLPEAPGDGRSLKRVALLALKCVVVAAVLLFVGRTAEDAWRNLVAEQVTIRPAVAVLAGLVFLVSMAPMAWFWRQTLKALSQPAPFGAAIRAFYVSQLGKYVPGKASVVLIRTERLLNSTRASEVGGGSARVVAASVFYETLTHMAVGALLAAVLTALVAQGDVATRLGWIGLSVALAAVCLTPTLPPVFGWLLAKVGPARPDAADGLTAKLTYGLSGQGALASAVGWGLGGVSVWLAAVSVGAADWADLGRLPLWVLATALPVVAGFVSLLPAGVLVREGLTLGLLAPVLGEGPALATTLAVRVIWVVSEVALCGTLLLGDWLQRRRRSSFDPTASADS